MYGRNVTQPSAQKKKKETLSGKEFALVDTMWSKDILYQRDIKKLCFFRFFSLSPLCLFIPLQAKRVGCEICEGQ